ncbi:MAG: hypothetical protein KF754_04910 [Planctomycetes bacterium]|nr:hypothetical protein [Planctomycetota bacterium]
MPDEKAIEIINKTTRERPARRWLFWTLIITVVMLLLSMIPIGGEFWRREQVLDARREYVAAVQPVRARFAGVQDWRAWYRARMIGSEGCAEFQAWTTRWGDLDGPGGSPWNSVEWAVDERLQTEPVLEQADPDTDTLQHFLSSTQAAHDQAQFLLRYDNLVGVPNMQDGVALSSILRPVLALNVIYRRALFLEYSGDRDGVVAELLVLLNVYRRMARPEHLGSYASTSAALNSICRIVEWLVQTGPLPPTIHTELRLAGKRDADFWRRMADGELAYVAQIFRDFDEPEFMRDPAGLGWFEWIDTSEDPGRNFEEFRNAGQDTSAWAAYMRALLSWADAPVVSPATAPQAIDFGGWPGMFNTEARVQLWLQRVGAASELRQLEAKGIPLHAATLPAGEFPDVQAAWRDGVMRVQYKPGPHRLHVSSAPDAEFDEHVPPLILTPVR